jgi:hypothetical protein
MSFDLHRNSGNLENPDHEERRKGIWHGEDYFRAQSRAFSLALRLGLEYNWKPSRYDQEHFEPLWYYLTNDGAKTSSKDAKFLARSLEKALVDIPEEKKAPSKEKQNLVKEIFKSYAPSSSEYEMVDKLNSSSKQIRPVGHLLDLSGNSRRVHDYMIGLIWDHDNIIDHFSGNAEFIERLIKFLKRGHYYSW